MVHSWFLCIICTFLKAYHLKATHTQKHIYYSFLTDWIIKMSQVPQRLVFFISFSQDTVLINRIKLKCASKYISSLKFCWLFTSDSKIFSCKWIIPQVESIVLLHHLLLSSAIHTYTKISPKTVLFHISHFCLVHSYNLPGRQL